MIRYYIKRSLKILRNEGPAELSRQFLRFLTSFGGYVRRPLLELQKLKLKIKYGSSAPSPYKLIRVDPSSIEYHLWMPRSVARKHFLNISWKTARYGTFVIGGDWDKASGEYGDSNKQKFEERALYQSTVEYFEEGIPWKHTAGLDRSDRCVEWFQRVEQLYNTIKSEGYKTQRELEDGYNRYCMPPEFDEIRVNIGRNGEIFFDDGRHRFYALKMLDRDTKIPVRVYVRHKQWQELRSEIASNGLPDCRKDLQDHPDLQDVLN